MKAGTDVNRDGVQLWDGVGLREGALAIVVVDERDVERIILRCGVGRRKRPGNWWTTQIQKRSAVMLDAVAVGVTVREDRRPVVGRDAVDRRIGCMAVMPIVGRRHWQIWSFWIWRLWRIRCLGRIWRVRVRGCRRNAFGAWWFGRRGRRIVLAWEFGRRGCGIFVTRKLRWGGSRVGIWVIVAGQLRRRGFRRDREPIGDEILRIDEPVIAVIIPLRRRRQSGILSSSCPTRTAVP